MQTGCIVSAQWPAVPTTDEVLVKASAYLMEVVRDFRKRMKSFCETKKVTSSHVNAFHAVTVQTMLCLK